MLRLPAIKLAGVMMKSTAQSVDAYLDEYAIEWKA